jgi:hypothetical protein
MQTELPIETPPSGPPRVADAVELASDKRKYRKILALERARAGQRGSHAAAARQEQRAQEAKPDPESTVDDDAAVAEGTSEDERNAQDKQSEEHRAE